MKDPIKVTRDQVRTLIESSFPGYRGRKLRVYAQSYVSLQNLNWSGGSRSEYVGLSLDGQFTGSTAKYAQMAPWSHKAEGASVDIPKGCCVVRHSIFMGKDSGLTFYINPEDMPQLLPSHNS